MAKPSPSNWLSQSRKTRFSLAFGSVKMRRLIKPYLPSHWRSSPGLFGSLKSTGEGNISVLCISSWHQYGVISREHGVCADTATENFRFRCKPCLDGSQIRPKSLPASTGFCRSGSAGFWAHSYQDTRVLTAEGKPLPKTQPGDPKYPKHQWCSRAATRSRSGTENANPANGVQTFGTGRRRTGPVGGVGVMGGLLGALLLGVNRFQRRHYPIQRSPTASIKYHLISPDVSAPLLQCRVPMCWSLLLRAPCTLRRCLGREFTSAFFGSSAGSGYRVCDCSWEPVWI